MNTDPTRIDMQLIFSPSSSSSSQKIPPQSRHISFKRAGRIPRASSPTSDATFPSMVTAASASRPSSSNSRPGIVDLTNSRSTSPLPMPKPARSRSPARPFPPPSFSGFPTSKAPPGSGPTYLAPPSRPESPRQSPRPAFIYAGDSDSEHRDDLDDSDDSDRTSFFSAEEYVVPIRALYNAGGRVLDARWQGGAALDQEQQALASVAWGELSDREPEQDAARQLRRWHALMEVVHSEAGYVRDLRVLVNVYLSLLPTLPLASSVLEAVQDITQDAVALLALHERFVCALEAATAQVVGGASSGSVEKAVQQLAEIFIDEASAFDLYQHFCSVQPDVVRLLRPAQTRTEWTAFERRCALGGGADAELEPTEKETSPVRDASDAHVPPKSTSPRTMMLMPSAFKSDTSGRRRHSYDSIVGVFGVASGTTRQRPGIVRPLSDAPSHSASRLRFQDFLIKPVQRICKYPLMLEGLRSKGCGDAADAVVAGAVESMRGVAMRVDEARRRRETAVKSKMIVERLVPHAVMTPGFLDSLGDCLLAGSLDVVHHHHSLSPITTPVRVKYLGGFLYLGGYLLLVKVGKGKAYRVKHWFSLAPFEVVDISPDTALVPSSFRLSYMDHHFEIAVACQREKDLWLRAINEARGAPPPWDSEPVSSLQILHTVPSPMSPTSDGSAPDTSEHQIPLKRGISTAGMGDPLSMLRLSSTRFRPSGSASPSASTPTIKYIFSHTDESSILLHRSSSRNRNFVDRGLADVSSDLVSSLRKQAQARQETLFPPPQLSDASQTIAIAAKNKLMRRGSVMVARPRGPPNPGAVTDREEESGTSGSTTLRRKAISTGRRRMALLPALSVLYTEPETKLQFPKPASSVGDTSPSSPPAMSRSLTDATGHPSQCAPLQGSGAGTDHNPHYHRRARSLVGSVKGLMRLGSTRSAASQKASEAWRALPQPEDLSSGCAENGSKRRRVSSAPTSPPASSANSVFFPDSDQGTSITSTSSDAPLTPPALLDPPSPSAPSGSKPFRKKSASILSNHHQTLKPRRSFKNFVFYNRLTTVDPA